jgi:hypothetical protein
VPRPCPLARAAALGLAGAVLFAVPAGAAGPSSREVAAAKRRAVVLSEQASRQARDVATARSRLAALAAAANAALDAFQLARERALQARLDAAVAKRAEEAAQARLASARARLAAFAGEAYRQGLVNGRLDPAVLLLTTGSPADLSDALALVGAVSDERSYVVDQMRQAEAEEAAASVAAAQTAAGAAAAEEVEATAQRRAAAAVAQQQALVGALSDALRRTRGAAAAAARRVAALERARRMAAARARAAGTSLGRCAGGRLSGYANGQLPFSALCPLWGAPSHRLRADAAAAFGRLSQAYAADFGAPICVTDSYRPYAVQVVLYRTKPALAAYPGTSEHGWGRAVDLCGGIQATRSRAHRWMQLNAPRFGWFHPSWAEPGGSRPEPWHWEYGG